MALTSALKAPDSKVAVGLAEAAAVFVIYQHALPNHADIRSAPSHDNDIEATRRRAAWMSAALLGLVFFMTQDVDSLWIGGAALAGMDLMIKHANAVEPGTGKVSANAAPADNIGAFPLPEYNSDANTESY